MLTNEQLQWLGLEASHRAFAFEERVRVLEETNGHLIRTLEETKALLERLRKGPENDAAVLTPAPIPPTLPPAMAVPADDDGVAGALDALAHIPALI